MAEPSKSWSAGEYPVLADDINKNFTEALNDYRDFVYGETIAVNDALYLKASDGKVYKTNANYNDERINNFVGFAKESGTNGQTKKVQIAGKVSGFSGLTTGSTYYLSSNAGLITSVRPANEYRVGIAVSTSSLIIMKGMSQEYLDRINSKQFILGETISAGSLVYFDKSNNRVYKTQGNDRRKISWLGFLKESGNAGDLKMVQFGGVVSGLSLTAGKIYHVSDIAGAISTTPGTYLKMVGFSTSTNELVLFEGDRSIGTNFSLETGITIDSSNSEILIGSYNLRTYDGQIVLTGNRKITITTIQGEFRVTGTNTTCIVTPLYCVNKIWAGLPEKTTTSINYETLSWPVNIVLNPGETIVLNWRAYVAGDHQAYTRNRSIVGNKETYESKEVFGMNFASSQGVYDYAWTKTNVSCPLGFRPRLIIGKRFYRSTYGSGSFVVKLGVCSLLEENQYFQGSDLTGSGTGDPDAIFDEVKIHPADNGFTIDFTSPAGQTGASTDYIYHFIIIP